MNIIKKLSSEFNLATWQAENATKLIDEGKTVPFIARYRKEATGEMSDEVLRSFDERLKYLRNLEERKVTVKNAIETQDKLTPEILIAIEKAETTTEVEDIYEPFKQKRKTRASVAISRGLEPLADIIFLGMEDFTKASEKFINPDNEINTTEEAIAGACDIIAERISDDFELKKHLRKEVFEKSILKTAIKKDAEQKENYKTYSMYFQYHETASKIPSHRVLAINRAEKEEILKVSFVHPDESIFCMTEKTVKITPKNSIIMEKIITDSLKRLILPSLERELRSHITEEAENRAIDVFGKNLKKLLLQGVLPDKTILGWDPAFRTGCKLAVIDKTGKVLATDTVYPTAPQFKVEETGEKVLKLIDKYKIDVIAIGNGTASRESEQIASAIIKKASRDVRYIIVSEAGASVYSASETGTEEFPDMNVSLRGAVSIARRLSDPLAELVKISPEHIGVGQYQHDVNQTRLKEVLKGVVEDAVNTAGVNLNTASYSLLSYVSGITPSIAKNIITYREETGAFKNRKQLLKVKRLGPMAFEQCAGFLRIHDGDEILDDTMVHPESYEKTYEFLNAVGLSADEIKNDRKNAVSILNKTDLKSMASTLNIGILTLKDIRKELENPGRDVRENRNIVEFKTEIMKLSDLKLDMKLKGTVRNVTDFGAFVDIGLKNDGLVHISELSDKYVKDPMSVVSVGDTVDVRVIKIDEERGKVALSMRKI